MTDTIQEPAGEPVRRAAEQDQPQQRPDPDEYQQHTQDVAHLIRVLAELATEVDQQQRTASEEARAAFQARVNALVNDVPELPDFSRFHDAFRQDPKSKTPEGQMREAFYMAYRDADCEHVKLHSPEIDRRLDKGPDPCRRTS